MRRIVITGLGMVAPTGKTVQEGWQTALTGRSCVTQITAFDPSGLPVRIAAEVKGFDPARVMDAKEVRKTSRFVQFTCDAIKQAVDDCGLDFSRDRERHGCVIGVGIGAFGDIEEGGVTLRERGPRKISPHLMPFAIPNMAAGYGSILNQLRGPNLCVATACASGSHAIGEAYLHIVAGNADVIVAGGAESAITPLSIACFARMRALSTRNDEPARASRPFDLDRDGFVMGEGSAVLVLEELEHARRRGARIYAELAGYGLSGDAYHVSSPPPEGEGLARCMASALRAAEVPVGQCQYINAHGTSTPTNDAVESAAIQSVFGEHAHSLSISSTKGATGHCLGAAGGIEAVYTVLAVHHGVVPPTANYESADPACPLDYTPREPRERVIRCALSNSCGFGGQNATLAFKHFA